MIAIQNNGTQNDFELFCADLSMNRTGLALLYYHADTRTVEVERMSIIDNKRGYKTHGEKLKDLSDEMKTYMVPSPHQIYIREAWVYVGIRDAYALAKTHGIADVLAHCIGHKSFYDMNNITVKKIIGGSGASKKEDVAAALELYVGKQNYVTDDESDAVAVGIAYLIQQGYIDRIKTENDSPEEESPKSKKGSKKK